MNDDYLWDKTGEPDPQVQQLEEILGTLRYQPQPLRIPQELLTPPRRQRNHWPLFAIAASVLLALLAAGIWLRVRNGSEPQPQQARVSPPKAVDEKAPAPEKATIAPDTSASRKKTRSVPRHGSGRVRSGASPTLAKREREEALAAKEQVMLALRLASEKLNLVHRKTQRPSANQIKNQHRVG